MEILTMVDKKKIKLSEKPTPKAKPGWPLIKVSYVGICGGDWHMVWAQGVNAGNNFVAGHEFSGVVVDPAGTKFNVGDRVTAIEYSPCGECEFCLKGKKHLCPDRFSQGLGMMRDGAFAEYLIAPEEMIYKLPDSIDDIHGAMIEPCAVGMHGARLAGVKEGSKVIITGGGAIGIFAAACAKALGASIVALTEVDPVRLQQAKEAPFIDFVLDGSSPELKDSLAEIANGFFDCAIECSGNNKAAESAIEVIKPGASMTIIAYVKKLNIDFFSFINDEKRIQGAVFFTPEDFQMVIDFMAEGKINIREYAEVIEREMVQDTFIGLDKGTHRATKYLIDFN